MASTQFMTSSSNVSTRDLDSVAPRPRRIPQQRRSRERYDHILSVARTLIAQRGNDAVSMREIADAADMAIGSVYQYFPDKNTVLWTLISEDFDRLETHWRERLDQAETVADATASLHDLFDAFVTLCASEATFSKLWSSVQANAVLVELDRALNERLASAYADKVSALNSNIDRDGVWRSMLLMTSLSSAALQLAFADERYCEDVLDEFRGLMQFQSQRLAGV